MEPQNPALANSPRTTEVQALVERVAGDCYWNDKRYSDGGTVCDSGQRFKCWSGKWVDIGNC